MKTNPKSQKGHSGATEHPGFERNDYILFGSAIISAIVIFIIVVFLLSTFKRIMAVYNLKNYHECSKLEIMGYVRILSEESSLASLLERRKNPDGLPILFIDMSMAETPEGLKEVEEEAARDNGETRVWELAALENASPGLLTSYFEKSSDDPVRWLETLHAATLVDAYMDVDFGREMGGHYINLFPGRKEIDEKILRNFENGLNRIYMEPDDDPKGRSKEQVAAEFLRDQLEKHPEIYKPKARQEIKDAFKEYFVKIYKRRTITQNYKKLVREYAAKNQKTLSPDALGLINRYLSEVYMETPVNFLKEERASENQSDGQGTVIHAHAGAVMCLASAPGDGALASSGFDNIIRLWNPDGKGVPREFKGHTLGILALAFSADGKLLASAGLDGQIRLWNVAEGREIKTFPADTSRVRVLAFSPDGKVLACGGFRGSVRLLDVESGKEVRVLKELKGEATGLVFSPDGHLLAAGSFDKTLRVWNLQSTGAEIESQSFKKHTGQVWDVKILSDGKRLASASSDRTVKLWKLGKEDAKPQSLKGHEGIITSLAASSDGKMLASVGGDRTLFIWDIAGNGKRLAKHSLDALVNTLQFSKDGSTLVLGCNDGTLRFCPVKLEAGGGKTVLDWFLEIFGKDKE